MTSVSPLSGSFLRGAFGVRRSGSVDRKDLEAWAARETAELLAAEALLLGRRSCAWFASRMRPGDGAEVRVSPERANRMTTIPKYVVTTVLSGDAVQKIADLKQTVAGEILIYGSYQLVNALVDQNLLDELRLVVFPIALGSGQHLFNETANQHLPSRPRLVVRVAV